MTAGQAASAAFPVGWYGKIPGTGDFISRRVPAAFIDVWDAWLQRVIEGSKERLGALWRDTFLSMPPWRFVLSAGLVTNNAWAGVLLPSVDAVGRYFPLTVACALPSQSVDLPATLLGAAAWFDAVEEIALGAIAPKADTAGGVGAPAGRRRRRHAAAAGADAADAVAGDRGARAGCRSGSRRGGRRRRRNLAALRGVARRGLRDVRPRAAPDGGVAAC
jgi:type VI secretion system ImpM family protein